MMNLKKWYSVICLENLYDFSYGSAELDEAISMALELLDDYCNDVRIIKFVNDLAIEEMLESAILDYANRFGITY